MNAKYKWIAYNAQALEYPHGLYLNEISKKTRLKLIEIILIGLSLLFIVTECV